MAEVIVEVISCADAVTDLLDIADSRLLCEVV